MKFTLYSKSNCPNCVSAKQLLQSKGLNYEERNAEVGAVLGELLAAHPDARQMPQILINGQRVGGLAGLRQALTHLGV